MGISVIVAATLLIAGCTGRERSGSRAISEAGGGEAGMEENRIIGTVKEREYTLQGRITIRPFGEFDFDPAEVVSVRDDIFREGHFSVFDVLVHLHESGAIDLQYHFDEQTNTYMIDAINKETNYWYMAYYDGGWSENNSFRMDHFPYKDRMHIRLSQYNAEVIDRIYEVFKDEVQRRRENDGKVVVPRVIVSGPSTRLEFENVTVTAHDLRKEQFQEGVITAIDVIMSLGDEGRLSYDLRWYDSIGSAEVVRNYFIDRVNTDIASGRCGFVYESGSLKFRGFTGNHIHLPADSRVLSSPEYVEFFWICI